MRLAFWRHRVLGKRMAKAKPPSEADPLRERREEEKEERRQAILDAAEKVIARDGWEATNFGEIATRHGRSRSTYP